MSKLDIKQNDKFFSLSVIRELEKLVLPSGQTNRVFLCRCDCGTEKPVRLIHLKRGRIKSCGCLIRNGRSKAYHYELRKVYRQMINRCSPEYPERKWYYDKGISVCSEWINNYDLFESWALRNGYEKGLHIDRSDNSKGYSPQNCRWVTPLINANNKDITFMVEYKGRIRPISILLRELNKMEHMAAIRGRIKRGWDTDEAIDTPIRKGNYH